MTCNDVHRKRNTSTRAQTIFRVPGQSPCAQPSSEKWNPFWSVNHWVCVFLLWPLEAVNVITQERSHPENHMDWTLLILGLFEEAKLVENGGVLPSSLPLQVSIPLSLAYSSSREERPQLTVSSLVSMKWKYHCLRGQKDSAVDKVLALHRAKKMVLTYISEPLSQVLLKIFSITMLRRNRRAREAGEPPSQHAEVRDRLKSMHPVSYQLWPPGQGYDQEMWLKFSLLAPIIVSVLTMISTIFSGMDTQRDPQTFFL